MYKANEDFKSYKQGDIKKGQVVEFNKAWFDNGLIIETKPEPEKKIEVKPNLQTGKQTKKGRK